ncbi:MAG: hypothetical protein R3F51_19155 [Cyanobacteriota/Melainabacteria group bacterium]
MNHHIEHLPTFVAILLVACFVGIAVKWIKMPYTIGLVLAGLMIGEFSLLPVVRMDPIWSFHNVAAASIHRLLQHRSEQVQICLGSGTFAGHHRGAHIYYHNRLRASTMGSA